MKLKRIVLAILTLKATLSFGARHENCLTEFMKKLNIDAQMMSSPQLIRDSVYYAYHLIGFKDAKESLKPYLTEPQDLSGFISQIKIGLLNNHPTVVEFVCQAIGSDLIPNYTLEETKRVQKAIHNMVVLNILVQKMIADSDFMLKIKDHYLSSRFKILPKDSSIAETYKAAGGVFETAKLLTMDEVIDHYVKLRTKTITENDLRNKEFSLRLNILEATLTDRIKGNFKNAYAGRVLLKSHIQDLRNDPDKGVLQYFAPNWTELYETWNLAFVVGNLDNLDLVLPKLLFPGIVNAKPEEYLFHRGLSLWITIQSYLLHNLKKRPPIQLESNLKDELVTLWGKVNKDFSKTLGIKPDFLLTPELLKILVWEATKTD